MFCKEQIVGRLGDSRNKFLPWIDEDTRRFTQGIYLANMVGMRSLLKVLDHNRDIAQMSTEEVRAMIIETYHKRYVDVMRA